MKIPIQSISQYAYSAARHLRTVLEVKKINPSSKKPIETDT